jgi:hypothetical protein
MDTNKHEPEATEKPQILPLAANWIRRSLKTPPAGREIPGAGFEN